MTLTEDLHLIIDRASQTLVNVRYNTQMLQFLVNNMMKIKQLPELADDGSQQFDTGRKNLLKALESGEHQIHHHAQMFDLRKFYTVEEAKHVIQTVCAALRAALQHFEMGRNLLIEIKIHAVDINKDREFLAQQLRFVLGHGDPVPNCSFLREWQTVKDNLNEELNPIKKDDIDVECLQKTRIGKGGSCVVYKALWSNQLVALKQLQADGDDRDAKLAKFAMEAAVTTSLCHPNVVHILAMSIDGIILMELADDTLEGWRHKVENLDKISKLSALRQAASGLEHLHTEGFVHCDVKSSNFLVFEDIPAGYPTVKICDLGITQGQTEEWRKTTLTAQPGTKRYMAPEIHDGKRHSCASDVFSMGVVMCEVMANCTPYGGVRIGALMENKLRGAMPCRLPDDYPLDLKNLITQCLSLDPDERPSMTRVREAVEISLKNIN